MRSIKSFTAAAVSLLVVVPWAVAAAAPSDFAPAGEVVVADPLPEAPAPRIEDAVSDAELDDLTFIAEQRGISVEEAIARFGWQNNFALAMDEVLEIAPAAFAAAEIVDGSHAWVEFVGSVPGKAAAPINAFRSAFPSVEVEVRTGAVVSEMDLESAMATAHYAVFDHPGVLDATTVFEPGSDTLVTRVVIDSDSAESLVSELSSIAADQVTAELAPGAADAIEVAVLHSEQSMLSGVDAGTSVHKGGEVWSTCSSGFGTRKSSSTSGTRGIASAGHCPNPQYDDGSNLTLKGEHQGTYGDFEWLEVPKGPQRQLLRRK